MSRIAPLTLSLVLLALSSAPSLAQQSQPFARVSFGATRVDSPDDPRYPRRVSHPSLALGYLFRDVHALELGVTRLGVDAPAREGWGDVSHGVRATPVELSYRYRPFAQSPVRPILGVGALWVRRIDSIRVDHPVSDHRSSDHGLSASLGAALELTGGAAAVVRGGYRHVWEGQVGIGLSGLHVDAGLELVW